MSIEKLALIQQSKVRTIVSLSEGELENKLEIIRMGTAGVDVLNMLLLNALCDNREAIIEFLNNNSVKASLNETIQILNDQVYQAYEDIDNSF